MELILVNPFSSCKLSCIWLYWYTRGTFLGPVTTDHCPGLSFLVSQMNFPSHHKLQVSSFHLLHFFSEVLIGKAAFEPESRAPHALSPLLGTRQWGWNALTKAHDPWGTKIKYLTYKSPPYYPFSYDNFFSIYFDRPFKLSNPEEHHQLCAACNMWKKLLSSSSSPSWSSSTPQKQWVTCKHVPLCRPSEQTAHHIIHNCPHLQPTENKIFNLTKPQRSELAAPPELTWNSGLIHKNFRNASMGREAL